MEKIGQDSYVAFIDPILCKDYVVPAFHKNNIKIIAIFTNYILEFFNTFSSYSKEKVFAIIEKEFANHKFDHIYYQWNYSNKKEFYLILRQYYLLQVFNASEYSLEFTHKLTKSLNLPGNSDLAVRLLQSKYDLNEFCRKQNIPVCQQLLIYDLHITANNKQKITEFGFPAFVKPASGCGTVDAKKINDWNALNNYLNKVKNFPIVIQEYLDGEEYFIDFVTVKGKHLISFVGRYKKEDVAGFPIYNYVEIVPFENEVCSVILNYGKQILSTIHWKNGLTHIEIMLTKKGPILIEVNSRASGGYNFINKLAFYSYNRDQFDILSECLVDFSRAKLKYSKLPKEECYARFVCLNNFIPNKIMGDFDEKKLETLPSYKEHIVFHTKGTVLSLARDLSTTVGFILLAHKDKERVVNDYIKIIAMMNNGELF